MTVNSSESLRHLGAGLKARRTAAGMTVRAVAEAIGTSPANISNWETAARLLSEERLLAVLDVLDPSDDERERLLGLRRQAEGPGELVSGGTAIGPRLARLLDQERAARRITEVAPLLIPGLLQTGDYARAVLAEEQDVETLVTLRMGRREILTRREPLELHAFIDDEVLMRPIGPLEVMAEQLRHLLAMMALPNVTVQLVPSTAARYSPHLAGPFILLEFASAPPVVHLEHYSASATLWEDVDVRRFMVAVEKIEERAMTPERTAEVIAQLVHGLET